MLQTKFFPTVPKRPTPTKADNTDNLTNTPQQHHDVNNDSLHVLNGTSPLNDSATLLQGTTTPGSDEPHTDNIHDKGFLFPEQIYLKDKPNVGLAFSGGGSRSAACTHGQLRGLYHLDLLEKTKYISCVSGSSWCLIPFLYGKIDRDWFLGDVIPPDTSCSGSPHVGKVKWEHLYSSWEDVRQFLRRKRQIWQQKVTKFVQVVNINDESSEEQQLEIGSENDPIQVESISNQTSWTDKSSSPSSEQIESTMIVQEESISQSGNIVSSISQIASQYKDFVRKEYFIHHQYPPLTQTLSQKISKMNLFRGYFKEHLVNRSSYSSYSNILHEIFCGGFEAGDISHYFSWLPQHVEETLKRNDPDLLSMSDFVFYTHPEDPYIIVQGTLLNLEQQSPYDRKSFIEFTPLYSGISRLYEGGKTKKGTPSPTIGGAYMENIGFNADYAVILENQIEEDVARIPKQQPSSRLSLSDVVSITSSAPAEEVSRRGLSALFPFPFLKFWSPLSETREDILPQDQTVKPDEDVVQQLNEDDSESGDSMEQTDHIENGDEEYTQDSLLSKDLSNKIDYRLIKSKLFSCGDGGLLDNSGVMSLLKRKTEFIVFFLNTRAPLHISNPIYTTNVAEDLSLLFGPTHYDNYLEEKKRAKSSKQKFFNYYPKKLKIFRTRRDFEINHVFEDPDGSIYKDLCRSLYLKRMRGESTLLEGEYTVKENPFFGIPGGWKCQVLWVYNDVNHEFETQGIDAELRQKLNLRGGGPFNRYPHFRTTFQNNNSMAGLRVDQFKLLSFQHTFNIVHHKDVFLDFFHRAEKILDETK